MDCVSGMKVLFVYESRIVWNNFVCQFYCTTGSDVMGFREHKLISNLNLFWVCIWIMHNLLCYCRIGYTDGLSDGQTQKCIQIWMIISPSKWIGKKYFPTVSRGLYCIFWKYGGWGCGSQHLPPHPWISLHHYMYFKYTLLTLKYGVNLLSTPILR